MSSRTPLRSIPDSGLSAEEAVSCVRSDLDEDVVPSQNLAGFHNTFMEPEIEELMLQHLVRIREFLTAGRGSKVDDGSPRILPTTPHTLVQ